MIFRCKKQNQNSIHTKNKNKVILTFEGIFSSVSVSQFNNHYFFYWFPTTYVVREKVMFWHVSVHPSVCPHLEGGTPARSSQGGSPARSRWGYPNRGRVPQWGYPNRGTPMGIPRTGGTIMEGSPIGGTPPWIPPPHQTCPGGTLMGGSPLSSTWYARGRYASCVHAGGLSCSCFCFTV